MTPATRKTLSAEHLAGGDPWVNEAPGGPTNGSALIIGRGIALALVLVGVFALSTPTAVAQEKRESTDAGPKRRALPVPPASEVEKDATQAAEELERRTRIDHWRREIEGHRSRRPDLDRDVTQGIQQRRLHDIPHR